MWLHLRIRKEILKKGELSEYTGATQAVCDEFRPLGRGKAGMGRKNGGQVGRCRVQGVEIWFWRKIQPLKRSYSHEAARQLGAREEIDLREHPDHKFI